MSLHDPSGFDPIDARWWPMIAAALPLPWPDEAVKMDLRWWLARERMGDGVRPGRPTLVKRYGWGDRRLRDLMAAPEKWEDAKNPAPRTGVQPRSSEGPADVQPRSNAGTVEPVESSGKVQPRSSEGPAEVQPRSTRAVVHRTPITDTVHREDTETRAPAKSKPSKVKPPPDQPSDSERQAFDDALGAIAEIDHGAALRIDAGTSGALRKSLLSAIRRDGEVVTVRRLRYVARSGDGLDLCSRTDGPGVGPLLHDPKRTNPRTGGPCWAAQLDDKAAAMAATPGGSRTLAQDTDSRWRDPGWSPTRRAEPPTRPGKPAESITERALTVHELARQLQETRHAARDHRHDDRDLLALEGGGPQAPGGVARRTG